MKEYQIKEEILNRLYETSSICSFCKSDKCNHTGNRELKTILKLDDVLRAIDLDRGGLNE